MAPCPLLVGGTGQAELVGLVGWARDRRVAPGAKQPDSPRLLRPHAREEGFRFAYLVIAGRRSMPLWDFAFFTSLFRGFRSATCARRCVRVGARRARLDVRA